MSNTTIDSAEQGRLGIPHLKQLWASISMQVHDPVTAPIEEAFMDILGLGYLPTYAFIHQNKPSFEAFESWVAAHFPAGIPEAVTEQCQLLFSGENNLPNADSEPPVLNEADLAHWQEHGYVILRNAISPEDCQATRKLIWEFLGMDENNPESWYQQHEAIQGIMVALFNHPLIHKNRYTPRIKKAFQQIWNNNKLIPVADKLGFNPPETDNYHFRGMGLHFDVSLASPIPFGTQGILYLTDTATHQGALTVVPGFHKIIHQWLAQLPPDKNPREEDLAAFGTKAIAAKAGDLIIWHHCLPHCASPNKAATPRLVQYMNWYYPFVEKQRVWL